MKSLFSIIFFIFLNGFSLANAQSSFELSCRNKAKEIAAETYKTCVTEQRQTQLEQIRKDYKEKLSELKNHYDKELKKLSPKSSEVDSEVKAKADVTLNTKKSRPSGARSLPRKTVKTEVIDLTSDESAVQSQNRMKSETDPSNDVEIVELPSQQE